MKPKVGKMKEQNTKKQARLFRNPVLEAMTKTSPLISIFFYLPLILALMYVAIAIKGIPVLTAVLCFIFAFFFWTLSEYLLHRFLFHWISNSKIVMRMHYLMHGVHHDYPNDEERLLMPPVPGLILASLLFGLFYLLFYILGMAAITWAFFPGFFLGYLMYSFIHYSIHKYKPPVFLKPLWLHHKLHHHKYPDKAFGVSSVFWDRVFRTLPPESNSDKKVVRK